VRSIEIETEARTLPFADPLGSKLGGVLVDE
jgi:hypothetical protein